MAAERTIVRHTVTGICIGLILSLPAHFLYLFLTSDGDRPDVPLPVGDSVLIPDDTTLPVGPRLRKVLEAGGYEALVLVNKDGNLRLANIDGTVKEPCFLNGQIIGIGECESDKGINNKSDHGNETAAPAPEAALLVYASSRSFCKNVDGVRQHRTEDPNPNAPANWDVNDKPCKNIEETANYQVHEHE